MHGNDKLRQGDGGTDRAPNPTAAERCNWLYCSLKAGRPMFPPTMCGDKSFPWVAIAIILTNESAHLTIKRSLDVQTTSSQKSK